MCPRNVSGVLVLALLGSCSSETIEETHQGLGIVTLHGEAADTLAVTEFDEGSGVYHTTLHDSMTMDLLADTTFDGKDGHVVFRVFEEGKLGEAIEWWPTRPIGDFYPDDEEHCVEDIAGITDTAFRELTDRPHAPAPEDPELAESEFARAKAGACSQACWRGDAQCTKSPDKCPVVRGRYSITADCQKHDKCYYEAKNAEAITACNQGLGTDVWNTVYDTCVAQGTARDKCASRAGTCSTRYQAGPDVFGGKGCNAHGKRKQIEYCAAALKNTGPNQWTCATRPCVCDACKADLPTIYGGVDCTSCSNTMKDPASYPYLPLPGT